MIESLGTGRDLLQKPIERVELIGTDAPITWMRDEAGLRVMLPSELGETPALTLRIR